MDIKIIKLSSYGDKELLSIPSATVCQLIGYSCSNFIHIEDKEYVVEKSVMTYEAGDLMKIYVS